MIHLSAVLGMLYAITIGCAVGRAAGAMFVKAIDPQAPAEPLSFLEAFDHVLRRSVVSVAFTFSVIWLLQSSENMTEPRIALLVSTDSGWRMYVFLSVFGLSLILSALESLLGAVLRRIGQLVGDSLDTRFKAVRP